jgi:tRNA pseudouridine38-40 synthase
MQRYFVELSYNGSTYFGWQRQPNQLSVQEEIENAFSKLLGNKQVLVTGCGRTDSGVHAQHYVLHVDLEKVENPRHLVFKLNRVLPSSVAIHSIAEVSAEMHARFSATSRTYRYYVHQFKDPFKEETSCYFMQQLDYEAMNLAANLLLGTKDFTSFSKVNTDVKTNVCTIIQAQWHPEKEKKDVYYFEITANRFLRNMVRATVGTLLKVGLGKMEPQAILEVLEKKDRGAAAVSVPAHGLYLWKVAY